MHTDSKGVYIHVPFCAVKCPYCDFYSCRYSKQKADAYIGAVCRNVEYYRDKGYVVDSLYFGGGTPSLLQPADIAEIIEKCYETFFVTSDCEITLECNPLTMNRARMQEYRKSGVNRISIGTQSFDDGELKILGRRHSAKDSMQAVENAYEAGFGNISCDLMTAFPDEIIQTLEKNIKIISSLPINHVSSYMLKIEEGTPFSEDENFVMKMPDEDVSADIYLETVKLLEEYGFRQYEISNFSKKSFESRHNKKYWQCLEYIGIGPSAHSFLNGIRSRAESNLDEFIKNRYQKIIVTDDRAGGTEEKLMLALRLKTGISLDDYNFKNKKKIENLQKAGLINIDEHRLHLTVNGFLVSNSVICELCESLQK